MNKKISTPIAIGIILILAIMVGVFTIWQYSKVQKENITQIPEIKIPEKKTETQNTSTAEITGTQKTSSFETANWKIRKELNYNSPIDIDGKTYYEQDRKVVDLNNDGYLEIIITLTGSGNSYLYIETLINEKTGEYKEIIAKYKVNLGNDSDFPYVNIVKTEDINNDGIKEIFLGPAITGGHSYWQIYRLISVDFNNQKINILKIQNQGQESDDFFWVGGAWGGPYYEGWLFNKDFNQNGKPEIVFISTDNYTDDPNLEIDPNLEPDCTIPSYCQNDCSCQLGVYEWNGSDFVYDENLSKEVQNKIILNEFKDINCLKCTSWEKLNEILPARW